MEESFKTKGVVIPYNVDASEHSLENVIPKECVVCDLKAVSMQDAVEQLVQRLYDGGHVSSFVDCVDAIMARERLMPTALEDGIDFPHARTSAARHLVSSIALCEFNGLKQRHILVLTIAPDKGDCPYMQYIGYMASRLYVLKDREPLLCISTDAELRRWFLER